MGAPRGPQQFFHDNDFEARTKCHHLVNKTFFFYSPFQSSDMKTCETVPLCPTPPYQGKETRKREAGENDEELKDKGKQN